MAKSPHAKAVDGIQRALRPFLRERGFRVRGRTFNRATEDGLVQVVNLQMGRSDPPGTTDIPEFRENLHGLFTVNLGVYVPEVARHYGGGGEARAWVQEYHCCVRARLGAVSGEEADVWWRVSEEEAVLGDLRRRLESGGFAFLDRYSTRDLILEAWSGRSENMGASSPPRIVMAIILAERGERARARSLLAEQASDAETENPRHAEYVRALAGRLGIGEDHG